MGTEKKYTVYRCGWKKGGTKHWFSTPIPMEDAEELANRWRNPNYIPKDEECNHPPSRVKLDSLECVILKKYRKPTDFADGKMRRVTVDDKRYFYQTIAQDDGRRITTIFDSEKTEIYKYNGDPHDYQTSGVKRIIREEKL